MEAMIINGTVIFLLGTLACLCLMLMGTIALLGSEKTFTVVIESQANGPGVRWRLAVGGAR